MRLSYRFMITCDILISFIILSLLNHTSLCYEIRSAGDALEYLSHFGYLNDVRKDPDVKIEDAREAVELFQDFAHINPSGKLTLRTLKQMNKPRCGNRDLRVYEGDEIDVGERARRRKRNDNGPGLRWHKRLLTYKINRFSSTNLKPKTLQKEIDLAFKYWERETNLTFKKIWNGKPDIEISFFSKEHGDEESFDGPSKTLAHAFYPTRGVIHFDDDEKWTANARHGHNLRIVAVHEIGHALGLGHNTKEKKSIMYMMYQRFKDKLQLHVADINAIQGLYGPKFPKGSTGNQNEVLKAPSNMQKLDGMISNKNPLDLCNSNSIDAIETIDSHIYIFKGEYYYKMDMGQPIDYLENPKLINETFHGLPSKLDTVLTAPNSKTYYFKGRLYWRSSGTKMDNGYPKKISENWLGIPNNLDASMVWSWNNMVYFFKSNRYWRYNFETPHKRAIPQRQENNKKSRQQSQKRNVNKIIPGLYPKRISNNFPGIPDNIEDAFKAPNSRSYIFKNGEYWQFHDPDSPLEAASYPRSSGEFWFGCSDFKPDARKIRHVKKRKPYTYI